jgi:hypothetical protein
MGSPVGIITHGEATTYLSKTANYAAADQGLIQLLIPAAEARVMDELGYDPTYGVRTEFLPGTDNGLLFDDFADMGSEFYLSGSNILSLGSSPIKSVTEVRLNTTNPTGVAADYPAAGILQPTAYYFDPRGRVIYKGGAWPTGRYNVMVTYVAGLTDEEIRSHRYRGIHTATLVALADMYLAAKRSGQAGGNAAGPIKSEEYPHYSVEYADVTKLVSTASSAMLSPAVVGHLGPHRRFTL